MKINWSAVSVIVVICLSLLSGFRAMAQTINRVDELEKTALRIDDDRSRDLNNIRQDIRSVRGRVDDIWKLLAKP